MADEVSPVCASAREGQSNESEERDENAETRQKRAHGKDPVPAR